MINYIKGDLFSHRASLTTKKTIFAHACNCRGSWGAGVASVFYKKYPSAFEIHKDYCRKFHSKLLGTTQLIPTQASDPGNSDNNAALPYVACLFTSDFAGMKKLSPPDIVHYTDLAMQDLLKQFEEIDTAEFEEENGKIVVNMPKINAGLFAVPWEETEAVLKKYDSHLHINVYVID